MNVFKDIPYNGNAMGHRKIVDEKHVLIMQIALKPGQIVPGHTANSNVHLLILKGSVTVNLNESEHRVNHGDVLPVAFKTSMSIENTGSEDATFLVIKTPNPSEMTK